MDVLQALRSLEGEEAFDCIFMDPPYNKDLERQVLEYLEDSSEVTNVICYAMEIQPSLIGANSKNGSINGTEARELFIIKQAMMKPIRDLLVLPLYIVKEINKWR